MMYHDGVRDYKKYYGMIKDGKKINHNFIKSQVFLSDNLLASKTCK